MPRAQNVLRHWRDDNKKFFHFVFMYSQSRKQNRNGNEITIPEVVFACVAMLSVSLCGTFNRVAVHENEMKKRFIVISAMSQHILSTKVHHIFEIEIVYLPVVR